MNHNKIYKSDLNLIFMNEDNELYDILRKYEGEAREASLSGKRKSWDIGGGIAYDLTNDPDGKLKKTIL